MITIYRVSHPPRESYTEFSNQSEAEEFRDSNYPDAEIIPLDIEELSIPIEPPYL